MEASDLLRKLFTVAGSIPGDYPIAEPELSVPEMRFRLTLYEARLKGLEAWKKQETRRQHLLKLFKRSRLRSKSKLQN